MMRLKKIIDRMNLRPEIAREDIPQNNKLIEMVRDSHNKLDSSIEHWCDSIYYERYNCLNALSSNNINNTLIEARTDISQVLFEKTSENVRQSFVNEHGFLVPLDRHGGIIYGNDSNFYRSLNVSTNSINYDSATVNVSSNSDSIVVSLSKVLTFNFRKPRSENLEVSPKYNESIIGQTRTELTANTPIDYDNVLSSLSKIFRPNLKKFYDEKMRALSENGAELSESILSRARTELIDHIDIRDVDSYKTSVTTVGEYFNGLSLYDMSFISTISCVNEKLVLFTIQPFIISKLGYADYLAIALHLHNPGCLQIFLKDCLSHRIIGSVAPIDLYHQIISCETFYLFIGLSSLIGLSKCMSLSTGVHTQNSSSSSSSPESLFLFKDGFSGVLGEYSKSFRDLLSKVGVEMGRTLNSAVTGFLSGFLEDKAQLIKDLSSDMTKKGK